ncbi:MAG: DUF2726 domain-containing protein [Candidatus Pacebacteria bacterium]|nr:DUF2726 domain-containing protein [Candidatus Paceibacterota bacterium]
MEILIIIVIIVCLTIYKINYWKSNGTKKEIQLKESNSIRYKKKFSLMNKTESALFFELQNQLPRNYHIFPNMRLADIVETINDAGYYESKKRNNKIMPKHIDFVICDSTFKPIVAIELNGKYHNNYERMEKDEEKKEILKEADLPLITVKVGDSFTESVEKIKKYLIQE